VATTEQSGWCCCKKGLDAFRRPPSCLYAVAHFIQYLLCVGLPLQEVVQSVQQTPLQLLPLLHVGQNYIMQKLCFRAESPPGWRTCISTVS
jgi:hypothetical protein